MPLSQGAPSAPSAVTVATTPTELVPIRNSRKSVTFQNTGSVDVFVYPSASVTTGNGFKIPVDSLLSNDDVASAAWYGIVASGTCVVRVMEVT
jgi:hypothetical protein